MGNNINIINLLSLLSKTFIQNLLSFHFYLYFSLGPRGAYLLHVSSTCSYAHTAPCTHSVFHWFSSPHPDSFHPLGSASTEDKLISGSP